ncbi:MAG TPA: cytochrome c peroxidase [Vicinamibacteria bacterium]|nr:cytochrome c peroxidase [Vicinamibacteria bacterium]
MAWRLAALVAAAALGAGGCGGDIPPAAPSGAEGPRLVPLSAVSVPSPVGSDVVDVAAAVRLGKVLFWDVQVGSDGRTACATCHFHAGADNRLENTIHPGPNGAFENVPGPGTLFAGGSLRGDDAVGSQGVVRALFVALPASSQSAADECRQQSAPPFGRSRQVTARNSPTVIGAVFYRQNFWDGRAHDVFNGVDPFGTTGNAGPTRTRIGNASLASQAVGPPNSEVESACSGRAFDGPDGLGAKLLARPPLQFQVVDPSDAVLGSYSNAPGTGLRCPGGTACTYAQLIAEAFGPALAADAEGQFARIWGQAVLAYESTLVPDQTPFDRHLAGAPDALTESEHLGFEVFQGKAACAECHAGPELSDATVDFAARNGLRNRDGGDQGFHNIGVRPSEEDLGRAAAGPRGIPFSLSGSPGDRGAFKTPGLRNVALTAPYFHNGSKATLADVMEFYVLGGEFANPERSSLMRPLSLNRAEMEGLLAFMTHALTDCRVERQRAPFDHPSLPFPDGSTLPAVGAAGTGPCPR